MDQRIATAKVQLVDRDSNKDVALGTSKINYIVSITSPVGMAVRARRVAPLHSSLRTVDNG